MELQTIINELQQCLDNCKSDAKSEWIEEDEKFSLQSDISILRQSLSGLKEIFENGCDQFFNNIKR